MRMAKGWTGAGAWCGPFLMAAVLGAAQADRPQRPHPSPQTPDAGDDVFFENAFEQGLVGARPAFHPTKKSALSPPSDVPESAPGRAPDRWSRQLASGVLEGEIKALHQSLLQALRSPKQYTEDTRSTVIDALRLVGCLFGIIDQYDGDVRWQQQAASAHGYFAAAASQLEGAGESGYPAARNAMRDLEELLNGGTIAPMAGASRVQSESEERIVMMRRMATALDERLPQALADADSMPAAIGVIRHEAELTAALAELLVDEGMPDADDDEYRACARHLRESALQLRAAATRNTLADAARTCGAIQATCTRCHDSFR